MKKMDVNSHTFDETDELCVSTLRALVIDEINEAHSGHPGMALDIAPFLYVLYKNYIVSDPTCPEWFNRDRFVLSSGHTSSLLYAMLHIAGYDISLDDLKSFRKLGSKTPGHPEYRKTPGIDATAGPLGQGIAQAVGVALAEEAIRARYPEGDKLCSHMTYCICGDGDLEEGISQEAISFAGLNKLEKLVLVYDENKATLDGQTSISFGEDEELRFKACGWNVYHVHNGNDLSEINEALAKTTTLNGKPTLIITHNVIGYGTELEGSNKCHGAPLGEEMGAKAKDFYGFDKPKWTVSEEVYACLKESFIERGLKAHKSYENDLVNYEKAHKEAYDKFISSLEVKIDTTKFNLDKGEYKDEATRNTSGSIIKALAQEESISIIGGSADVASSVKTSIPGDPGFSDEHRDAKSINFGIREFEMASIMNGILLHRGLRVYGGSFLIFSDYMKSAMRMSAMEQVPAIYLLSHDSIAVGEDGPTHQPIEQIWTLRMIPNFDVIRPCDARETYAAWEIALNRELTPTGIILSRQALPVIDGSSKEGVKKGGYIISPNEKATIQLVASGSEIELCKKTQELLKEDGIETELVSLPSIFLFEQQDENYKSSVLRLGRENTFVIEMGQPGSYYKYADHVYGIEKFGSSGNIKDLLVEYGYEPKTLANYIKNSL